MRSVGVNVKRYGNACIDICRAKLQRAEGRNSCVGRGVPDEGGRRELIYVALKRELLALLFRDLVKGLSEKMNERALVSGAVCAYDGVREDDALRLDVRLGDAESVKDERIAREESESACKMCSCGESDCKNSTRVPS